MLLILMSSCEKDNKFLIAKNQLGDLTNTTKISQIESLLAQDSVILIKARDAYGREISSAIKEVEVYDTSAQQILNIKPSSGMDSVSLIQNVRILTDRYKTVNGIALGSTFAEVKKHHDINNIQTSLKSVIITLKDLNAFISFDKEVLSGDVRFDLEADIKPTMIPDDAEINRFWINFEADQNKDEEQ